MLNLMIPPIAASLVILSIHAYLGLHVIARGMIFVDLAFAQIAALGATVGFLMASTMTRRCPWLFRWALPSWERSSSPSAVSRKPSFPRRP